MNSAKLSERILDCLEYDNNREQEKTAIYNELSQVNSYNIRSIIVNLCEKIEEFRKENG